jgi:hypothetical protein
VGIGLLKEGDDAYCISDSRPFGAGFYGRPIMCSYLYRRETPQKVTIFSKNFSKLRKKPDNTCPAFIQTLYLSIDFTISINFFGLKNLDHYLYLPRGLFH